jgi:hypothetical protein
MSKHFAFLLDCPNEGEVMMFYNYYENMKDHIDEHYDEVEYDITGKITWNAALAENGYKVFKKKQND